MSDYVQSFWPETRGPASRRKARRCLRSRPVAAFDSDAKKATPRLEPNRRRMFRWRPGNQTVKTRLSFVPKTQASHTLRQGRARSPLAAFTIYPVISWWSGLVFAVRSDALGCVPLRWVTLCAHPTDSVPGGAKSGRAPGPRRYQREHLHEQDQIWLLA